MPGIWAALLAVYVQPRTVLLNKKMKVVNINTIEKEKKLPNTAVPKKKCVTAYEPHNSTKHFTLYSSAVGLKIFRI